MIPSRALEAVTTDELAKAATLFSALKQLRIKLSGIEESVLDNAFETHVQVVLERLESRLPSIDDNTLSESEIIMARHGLFDASFQQAILLCQAISPALGDSLKDIRSTHSGYFSRLQKLVTNSVGEISSLRSDISQLESRISSEQGKSEKMASAMDALDQENEELKNNIIVLRQQLRETLTELNDYRDGINVGGGTTTKLTGPSMTFDVSVNKPQTPTSSSLNGKKTPSLSTRASGGGSVAGSVSGNSQVQKARTSSASGSVPMSNLHFSPDQKIMIFRNDIQKAIDEGRCRDITLKECLELISQMYESKVIANTKARQGVGNIPMETMEQHIYRVMEKKYGLRSLAVEHAGMLVNAVNRYIFESNDVLTFQKIFRNEVEEDFRLVQQELHKSIRDLLLVQIMARNPTKDQPALLQLLEQKMSSFVTEDEWTDMMHYLYNENDSMAVCLVLRKLAKDEMAFEESKRHSDQKSPLDQLFKASDNASQSSLSTTSRAKISNNYYSATSSSLNKGKYGTANTSTPSKMSTKSGKDSSSSCRLSTSRFLKAVLDFQLKSHEEYLKVFREAFRKVDDSTDGILSVEDFYSCFQLVQASPLIASSRYLHFVTERMNNNEQDMGNADSDNEKLKDIFVKVVKLIDPLENDIIVFSEAVSVLNKLGNL